MSSLSMVEIKNLPIDKINEILNSGKYIPEMKKKTLIERKKLLDSKNFNGIVENEFPSLGSKKNSNKKENVSVWSKGITSKVLDKSNVPEIKKKDILKNENKKSKVVKKEEYYSSDEEYYNHDDDYDYY